MNKEHHGADSRLYLAENYSNRNYILVLDYEVNFISMSLIIVLEVTPGENDLVEIRALKCNTENITFISNINQSMKYVLTKNDIYVHLNLLITKCTVFYSGTFSIFFTFYIEFVLYIKIYCYQCVQFKICLIKHI